MLHRENRSNPACLAQFDNKDLFQNAVDYTHNFTQLHALITSFASFYLQNYIFKHCVDNNIEMLYTSTDSLVLYSDDVSKMSKYMSETELGKMKIEAVGNGIFIKPRCYYINESKYASLNKPHQDIVAEYACARDYFMTLLS